MMQFINGWNIKKHLTNIFKGIQWMEQIQTSPNRLPDVFVEEGSERSKIKQTQLVSYI